MAIELERKRRVLVRVMTGALTCAFALGIGFGAATPAGASTTSVRHRPVKHHHAPHVVHHVNRKKHHAKRHAPKTLAIVHRAPITTTSTVSTTTSSTTPTTVARAAAGPQIHANRRPKVRAFNASPIVAKSPAKSHGLTLTVAIGLVLVAALGLFALVLVGGDLSRFRRRRGPARLI